MEAGTAPCLVPFCPYTKAELTQALVFVRQEGSALPYWGSSSCLSWDYSFLDFASLNLSPVVRQ